MINFEIYFGAKFFVFNPWVVRIATQNFGQVGSVMFWRLFDTNLHTDHRSFYINLNLSSFFFSYAFFQMLIPRILGKGKGYVIYSLWGSMPSRFKQHNDKYVFNMLETNIYIWFNFIWNISPKIHLLFFQLWYKPNLQKIRFAQTLIDLKSFKG